MTPLGSHVLAPIIQKLERSVQLGAAAVAAFLNLPFEILQNDPGDILVEEGQATTMCIALLSGFMYRSKEAGSGAQQILAIHLRGDLVDLQNSLLDTADHDVRALTRTKSALIPVKAMLEAADKHTDLTHALLRDALVDASLLREWMLNVGQRHARQRIAHLLCELALRQEAAGLCAGPIFTWPMTQEQIGKATGLTNVHVNRMLRSLKTDGLIAMNNLGLKILDWDGLQVAGDFSSNYLHHHRLAGSNLAAGGSEYIAGRAFPGARD